MRQPEASGTKGKSENNDVTLCAKHLQAASRSGLGHRQECLCY